MAKKMTTIATATMNEPYAECVKTQGRVDWINYKRHQDLYAEPWDDEVSPTAWWPAGL